MSVIIIDGREMTTREATHVYLAKILSLPYYYGNNLDALYDCLTEVHEPTQIIVAHCDTLMLSLGSYGTALLQVLNLSAEENGFLTVSFHADAGPCEEGSIENNADKNQM